jgi:hypothetical protein
LDQLIDQKREELMIREVAIKQQMSDAKKKEDAIERKQRFFSD